MSLVKEFREFAVKGNAVDMAVGLIIGAAFGKVVSSLVNDVINPPLGMLLYGKDFANLAIVLKGAVVDAGNQVIQPAVTLGYGALLSAVFDFLILAVVLFTVVKGMNRLRRGGEQPAKS